MSQFKPGDLALIVGSDNFPDQIGAVCELVQFLRERDEYQTPCGQICHAPKDAWLIVGDAVIGGFTWGGAAVRTPGQAIAPESNLMPLRGDFAPEQQKSREVAA